MELKLFLKGKNRKEFAEKCGTTLNYLNLLACHARRPSPELAAIIQKESNNEVTIMELLYPNGNGAQASTVMEAGIP